MSKHALNLLENHITTFTESDKRIYSFVKKHWKTISEISISRLADESKVSKGTASKFFKKCGFDGFKGFKQMSFASINNTGDSEMKIITMVQEELATPQISAGIEKAAKAALKRKVVVVGSQYNEFLSNDFAKKCNIINLDVTYEDIEKFSYHVTGDEFFIFVSMSGTRRENILRYINYAETASNKKIDCIYMSSSPRDLDISNIKYSIKPIRANYAWKYEREIPRVSFFSFAYIIDRLYETIFDANKEHNMKLLEIIHGK